MSDFDFDELDKAVNGAINTEVPNNELVETLDTTENDEPAKERVAATTPVSASQPARSAAPAARRSSGRFMDVVHPSSDMRPGSEMPNSSRPQTTATAPAAVAPVVQPDPVETSLEDWQKPLESPFLSDAKVEKRPLGGEAPTTTDFDPIELLEEPDDPRIEAHAMPDPIDFATQSNSEEPVSEQTTPIEEVAIEVEPVAVEQPAAHSEVPMHVENDTAMGYGEGSFQPEPEQDVPTGPTSIHQQYKEQPSSSKESGPIYDTEAYHQPLAPIAKKKKPSFAILWILLILILGAGASAAFYFYVLPTFQ
jgi:hypothetical protein